MEENQKELEELSTEPRQGSGSILAQARKKQQKSIEEIAQELNLSVTQIKAIELDQSDGLPEPTYVRGYIRAYAKLLGLKPEEVLQSYLNPNWQQSTSLNDIPRGIGSAESSSPGFFSLGKVVALLVVLIAGGLLWYSGVAQQLLNGRGQSPDPIPSEVIGSQNQNEQNAEIEVPAGDDEPVDAQQESDQQPLASGESDQSAADIESQVELTPASNQLKMEFSATSWVDIRDGNDNRLAYKSYTSGDVLEIEEEGELQVFIGNAEGVAVEFNGQAFDLAPHREGVYAKFVIDPAQ